MPKRMTWDEMVEKYPDKWVVLDDVKYISEDDDINIESALVIQVVPDESANDIRLNNNRKGRRYTYRRTTEYLDFMGVML